MTTLVSSDSLMVQVLSSAEIQGLTAMIAREAIALVSDRGAPQMYMHELLWNLPYPDVCIYLGLLLGNF